MNIKLVWQWSEQKTNLGKMVKVCVCVCVCSLFGLQNSGAASRHKMNISVHYTSLKWKPQLCTIVKNNFILMSCSFWETSATP
jgi:hypothetical protein